MCRSILLIACLLSLTFSVSALAVPITFIHQGVATGSIGDLGFEDTAFTISAYGDTDNRNAIYFINHDSASINISGIGTYTLLTATRTFSTVGIIGFSRAGIRGYDLFNQNAGLPSGRWDMLSSFGPYSGTGYLTGWAYPGTTGSLYSDINTSSGLLYLRSAADRSASFEAIVGASTPVPEPATVLLLGSGLIGLAWYGRKRKQKQA